MEINAQSQVQHPQLQHRPKTKKRKFFNLIFAAVLALFTLGAIWQQTVISSQNKEIENLKKTQLSQNKFANFIECAESDGVLIEIINSTAGCVSGEVTSGGDRPKYKAFLRFNANSLPRILERQKSENKNTVTNNIGASKELVAFLENDYWGCQTNGEYKIIKEVRDRFALMQYGCTGDGSINTPNPPTIIGIKLADGWSLISSANYHMNNNGQPSCLLVDLFKVSKELTPKCFENTDYDEGKIKDVLYP